MKVDNTPREFEANTPGGTSAFKIAASSKAFQILSNQLYTDKPRAILRELSTNALDAHIAAGKPEVPFEVQLPNTWNSTLIVKDFGTGMSPAQISELYTTYFGSDKTHTNDLVGGLGLGSKSPFSYTDQFTAVSRYEGTKYTYAAFIGASNTPEITLVSEEPTDEENGFEVHVPVKESDIRLFSDTARRVFEFFEVKPTTNKEIQYTVYDAPVMQIEHEDIVCELYENQDTSFVMQGPIGYPIDVQAVTSDIGYDKRSKVEAFLRRGWRIKAPVGTFEIVASREALSYDKKTIARMLHIAESTLAKVRAKAVKELAAAKDVTEAGSLLRATSKYLSGAHRLDGEHWNHMKWESGRFYIPTPDDVTTRVITKRKWGRSKDPHTVSVLAPGSDLEVGKGTHHVVWCATKRPYKAYLASRPPLTDAETLLYFIGPEDKIKAFLKKLGLPMATELPKIAKQQGVSPTGRTYNYGATEYKGHCFTATTSGRGQSYNLSATANTILDEPNAIFILTEDAETLYTYKQHMEVIRANGILPDDHPSEVYGFYVPSTHTKVRKALEAHPGHRYLSTLQDQFLPKKEIERTVAKIEARQKALTLIKPYQALRKAVDMNFVKHSGILDFCKWINSIEEADNGPASVYATRRAVKAMTAGVVNLDTPIYNIFVNRFTKALTKDIMEAFKKYHEPITQAVEGFESCNHWNYPGSKLQAIVTEWVNNEVEAIDLANVNSNQQEVA